MKNNAVKFKRYLVASFISILVFPLAACQIGSFGSVGGFAVDSQAEELTTTQSQLFDDGPVAIPVTVAKMDSPDLDLITVTAESIVSNSESAFLLQQSESADSSDYLFTVTGEAGAFNIDQGSKLFIFNATLETYTLSDLNMNDGSGEGSIIGSLTDVILFAVMTESETQISPPLIIDASLGTFDGTQYVFPLTTTNTMDLVARAQLLTDQAGNYYLVLDNEDGTYTFARRNSNGSAPEIIASDLTSPPLVVTAVSGDSVTAILQDGTLMNFTSQTTNASFSALANENSVSTEVSSSTSWSSQEFDTIDGELVHGSTTTDPGYDLIYSANEDLVVMSLPAFNPHTHFRNPQFLRIQDLDLNDGNDYPDVSLILREQYLEATSALGEPNWIYSFIKPNVGGSSLIKFELIEDATTTSEQEEAFVHAETLIDDYDETATQLDVSDNGVAVFLSTSVSNTRSIKLWSPIDGLQNVADSAPIAYPKISPQGDFVLMCKQTYFSEDGKKSFGQLVMYTPGSSKNEYETLFDSDDFYTCASNSGSYTIDNNNMIHFYKIPIDFSEAQMTVLDPRKHPAFDDIQFDE